MWAPKHWDLSLTSLAQYTIPKVPPENPWIDRARIRSRSATPPGTPTETHANSPLGESRTLKKGQRRPPSRRLVRHVLRARIEAAKALASMFAHLEKSPKDIQVRSSSHLARAYGGTVDEPAEAVDDVPQINEPLGWRSAKEIVSFLRRRGAKFASLKEDVSGSWAAALSSDAEGFESEGASEDLAFVTSSFGSDLRGRQ